jgi:hypothetical protein
MGMHLRRIVVTENGVYQPPPVRLEVALLALALLAVALALLVGRLPLASALLDLALLVALAVARVIEYRKHGRLGRPSTALLGNTLVFARPNDSRGDLRFAVADLQQVVIYGRVGRRTYRFVRQDGTCVEAGPMWRRSIELPVTQFLLRRLPPAVQVTVAEPQTLFASIRGDGP